MDVHAQTGLTTLPELVTDRLVLRPTAQADPDAVAAAINDYSISKWLTVVPFPYTRADAVWFIEENRAGRAISWSIFAGEDLIGNIGGGAELGYWLVPSAWGNGYATEAGRAVIDHWFATTDDAAINSAHFTENLASRHVLVKLGFEDVGGHVHHSVARGTDVPGRSMRLTRARWTALRLA